MWIEQQWLPLLAQPSSIAESISEKNQSAKHRRRTEEG